MTTSRLLTAMIVVAAGLLAAEVTIVDEVHGGWWHGVAGFELVIGFVGCLALVWGAKVLGKLGLQRPEHEHPEDEP